MNTILWILGYICIGAISMFIFAKIKWYAEYGHGSSNDDRAASIIMKGVFWPIGWLALLLTIIFGSLGVFADFLIRRFRE